MEDKILNILIDMKTDIGGLKKNTEELRRGQEEFRNGQEEIKERVYGLEVDIKEVKTTVNAIAEALLETSREVIKLKGGNR